MLLSNADRERLKLWPIKPYDMTDAELEAQRKTKINERRKAKRQARKDYLASSLNTLKPWQSGGISRAYESPGLSTLAGTFFFAPSTGTK
jgi:hypothetical protein